MALFLYGFWALTWLGWVLLALAPTSASPDWILSARQYCFGTLPQTLPGTQGWLLLTAPIPMLITLLAICGQELRIQLARLYRPLRVLLLMLPFLTIAYAGVRVIQEWTPVPQQPEAELPLSDDYPKESLSLPNFKLKDQNGNDFGPENFKGQVTVLTFAYAHCETACPILLQTLRQMDGYRRVVVTLDPWRDTCGSLLSIAKTWELGDSTLLSGEPAQVELLTKALAIPITRDEKTGEIFHPSLMYILNAQGQVVYTFNNPPLEWLEEAAKRASKP